MNKYIIWVTIFIALLLSIVAQHRVTDNAITSFLECKNDNNPHNDYNCRDSANIDATLFYIVYLVLSVVCGFVLTIVILGAIYTIAHGAEEFMRLFQ